MPISKEQAINEKNRIFHVEKVLVEEIPCPEKKWRRNGKTKVWATRPKDFEIPVKHGLYRFGYIRNIESIFDGDSNNSFLFHLESDCPNKKQNGS